MGTTRMGGEVWSARILKGLNLRRFGHVPHLSHPSARWPLTASLWWIGLANKLPIAGSLFIAEQVGGGE